jgi:putative MATE family efflux protein
LDLTKGNIFSQMVKLTLPMVMGIFAIFAFNLIDTFFVAQLGGTELAALSFTFPVVGLFANLALGMGIGATVLLSRAIGKKEPFKVKCLTTDSLILSFLTVVVFIVFGLLTIQPVFLSLGAPKELIPYIEQYMFYWYLGMPFLVIPMVGNSAIRSTGDTKTPAIIMLIAAGLNTILDPIMIFGWGPIPKMGIEGAAIATVISRFFTLLASVSVLHFREKMLINPLHSIKESLENFKNLIYVGFPAAIYNMLPPISMAILTKILAGLGHLQVAGFGVYARVEAFAFILIFSAASSLGPFIGQNYGAGKIHRIKTCIKITLKFALIWGGICFLILSLLSHFIASKFSDDLNIVYYAETFLNFIPWSYLFLAPVIIINASFNALGKTIYSALTVIIHVLLLSAPLSFLGTMFYDLHGFSIGLGISHILILIFQIPLLYLCLKRAQ